MTTDTMNPTTTYPTLRSFARALVGAAAVLSLAACDSDPVSFEATTGGGEALTMARFTAVEAFPQSGQGADTARARTVITDAAEWTRFWASLAPDPGAGAGGPPAVDFAKDMVIAAVMPLRPSGGYRVHIERVTEFADRIEAEVVEHSPAADCFTTGVITRPFDVVQVPRRAGKPVQFKERRVVTSCSTVARTDTVRVKVGQSVDARGVKVTLQKVLSDSRCPLNAICVWEGDAAVALRFEPSGGRSVDATLHTSGKGGVVSVSVGGTEFRLIGLTPFPVAGQAPPAESEYTAILAAR